MTAAEFILLAIKISILLSVFALGLRATIGDATLLFRHPRQLARAFLSMNVVMPLIALGLCVVFNIPPAVRIALVTLSVSPVPPIFNSKAHKAGGREDRVVGALAATAILAILFIPLAMELMGRIAGVEIQMTTGAVAKLVLATMLLPLFAGIGLRALLPGLAEKVSKPLGIFSAVLLAVAALPILIGAGSSMFSLLGNGTLASFAAFVLAGFLVGDFLGGPGIENKKLLAMASATRHPGMAIAIAHTNFPEQKLAVPAVLLYLIVNAIVSAIYLKKRFPESSSS